MRIHLRKPLSIMLAVMILSCSMSIFAIAAYENNYSNTGNQRIDIIGVAKTQVGYAEGNNNNNKYGYYFGHNYVPWCAYFIVWCARQANIGSNTIKLSGYADADDLGVAYKSRGSYTPQTGDIIIFDYAPYSTKTPASSYGDHVGLVEYVDGNYVHTIEGNANNAVRRYTYSLSNSNIKGYGVPNYSGGYTHTRDSSYGTNFTSYPKAKITASNIFDANHTQISSTCWIGTSDQCTIHEVYTDGCCKVTYPLDSGGSKTVYSKISLFNTHTHSYSKNYEAAHPHRYYMKCSCGDYYYTGETKYLATCSSCHTHSYTGDLKYQPDHPHRISQRCTEYSSCGGFIWLDKYYYCSDCSQCQSDFGARIKASVSSITLDLNGKNTQTITVTADGHIPWGYRFNRNIADTSVISGTWAEKLIDNKTSITVTGKKCGSTNLTLSVYETTTGNKNTLHKIVIPVTVTCSHSYNSGTVTTAPTCKSTGVKTYTCTVCKATKTGTIAKTAHSYDSGKITTAATCAKTGVKTYTCTVCKATKTETIAKTAHSYNSGKITTAATCAKTGVKTYTCTVCKATKTATIAKTAHSFTGDRVYVSEHPHRVYQKCVNYSSCGGFAWLDEYHYCSDCSQCQSDFGARIKASASSVSLDLNGKNTQTITVTVYGNVPSSYGINCHIANGSLLDAYWAEKLVGNNTSITVTGKKCGSTNLTLSVYETTTGNKNTLHKIVIPVTVTCSHSYNSGTVTTAATCKSTGVKTYTCTVCKATKTETIAKNSSNHTGGTTIKNAKSATCSSEGYTGDKYCSGCGAKLSTGKTIAKTAHPWNSGTVTTAATCTKAGVKTYTCTVCKATKTENIPVIAHTAVKDPAIAASCTKTGLTEGSHCSTCNTVIRKQETTKALGHDFNGASHTNSDGSISYKCTRCDEYGNTVYPQPTEENLDAISGTKRIMENNLDILVAPVEMTAESIFKAAKGGKLADSSGNEITNGNTPLATGMKILPGNSEICVSILGDVDCDGDIDVADARFALRAAVKLDTLTDVCFIAADIDFSKDISVSDARLILRAAVKLDEPKAWLK